MAKLEAVWFFNDLITIFARKTLHSGLIRQAATSVIGTHLTHYWLIFNKKRPLLPAFLRDTGELTILPVFWHDSTPHPMTGETI